MAPGLLLAGALAQTGHLISDAMGGGLLGVESSPVSPILIAILLGLLIRNTIGLPQIFEHGLDLSIKRILRLGVALLGIKLSVFAVGGIGLSALPIVVACIGSALLVAGLATRLLALPMRLGTLVAVGTAICGNTAIVAMAPVIGASDDETSYAVGTITLFGLIALFFYPFVAHFLFGADALLSGIFLGTAIHDTAQVAGAGLLYDQQFSAPYALEAATVTKLLRNTFMILVIPLAAIAYRREENSSSAVRLGIRKIVPFFVIGFVLMAGLRTWGDLGEAPLGGLLTAEQWEAVIAGVSDLSVVFLTVAMASVGLGTHLARLKVLGFRPLVVGFMAALAVGVVSALLLGLLGPLFETRV